MLYAIPQYFISGNLYLSNLKIFTNNTYFVLGYFLPAFSSFFSFNMLYITSWCISGFWRSIYKFIQTLKFINIQEGFISINCFTINCNYTNSYWRIRDGAMKVFFWLNQGFLWKFFNWVNLVFCILPAFNLIFSVCHDYRHFHLQGKFQLSIGTEAKHRKSGKISRTQIHCHLWLFAHHLIYHSSNFRRLFLHYPYHCKCHLTINQWRRKWVIPKKFKISTRALIMLGS